jgi:hypothetical protein
MEVKTWQPNPDCKQCAQAVKNNYESNASGKRIYTLALKQANTRYTENVTLKARVADLEEGLFDQLNDCINFDGGKLTDCIMQQSSALLQKPRVA